MFKNYFNNIFSTIYFIDYGLPIFTRIEKFVVQENLYLKISYVILSEKLYIKIQTS